MAASPRFCPFCGQANDAAYSFCMRCGKPLPSPSAPQGAVVPPPTAPTAVPPPPADWSAAPGAVPAAAAPSPGPVQDTSPIERPLTDGERKILRKAQRAPAIGVPRMLATLFGIAPLFLIFMSFMGTPFDPGAFPAVMIGAAVFAVVLGGVSMSKRAPIAMALARGTVHEARGVPRRFAPLAGGLTPVTVGGVSFLLDDAIAGMLLDGRMNVVVYATQEAVRGRPGPARTWLLSVNGVPFPQPKSCRIPTTNADATIAQREIAMLPSNGGM